MKEKLTLELKQYLGADYAGDVYRYDVIGSTNDEAKKLARAGAVHGTLVLANTQTSGRGRGKNSFHSPEDTGIYMSVIIKPKSRKTDTLYTVAAAVAVRRVLDRYTDKKAEIKWVNDIYISERKVCGILCEAVRDNDSQEISAIICGIGVNLKCPTAPFPEEIKAKAGYVTDKEVSKERVAAELAVELLAVIDLENDALIREYSDNMMLRGREVYYKENETLKKAKVTGVDCTGGLVVRDSQNKEQILRSGEVHIEKF